MTPTAFLHICRAEIDKLFSRGSARAGLVIATLVAMAGPVFLYIATGVGIEMNGQDVGGGIPVTGANGVQWALEVRNNSQILRALILMLTALSVAGEFNARTIREDLLRPVPRWTIPVAKWVALCVWIATSLVVAWVFGSVVSTIAFGLGGTWGGAILGFSATLLSDAGFAALALLIAILSRSVAGTVAGVLIYIVLDTVLGWALSLLGWAAVWVDLPSAIVSLLELQPWLPSSAFGAWIGYAERAAWDWRNFVSLLVITGLCLLGAERFFHRVDVP